MSNHSHNRICPVPPSRPDAAVGPSQHTQQAIGVPPIIKQQQHPAFMHPMMQSQHAWIIAQHAASPLVQVMQHPFAVISHLHIAIVMLQQHTVMPFMVQHIEHMPPAVIAHRFCIIVHAAGSSHSHVTFIPPAHFSTFIMHFGTIIMFTDAGIMPEPIGMFPVPIPGIIVRSIIIALVMFRSVKVEGQVRGRIPSVSSHLDH